MSNEPSGQIRATIEDVLNRFEAEWRSGRTPEIRSSVPEDIGPRREEVIRELVRIDLEYRWRNGIPFDATAESSTAENASQVTNRSPAIGPLIEHYFEDFTELGPLSECPTELIVHEYRVRHWWGDRPGQAEYLARFTAADQELFDGLDPSAAAVGLTRSIPETPVDAGSTGFGDPLDPGSTVMRASQSSTPRQEPAADFGDYEILGKIARGGMGVVYKARQRSLNRIVALKMIGWGTQASDEEIQRFFAEAESAARLNHPNIVPIHEVGEVAGRHYFSMAFVDGESLAARLADGPLPPREAAELIRVLATAIHYAHENGIVHRDLKPANVLLERAGDSTSSPSTTRSAPAPRLPLSECIPKITDFGLAKQIERGQGLTVSGQIMGTPGYMPPEQAAGATANIGPRSDTYSLGAMLYCTLVGRPPFQAANVIETLRQVIEEPPVSPRELNAAVDRDVETICLKCLEKQPERRYASAKELADDLQRYLDRRPIIARPISASGRFFRWYARNRMLATSILLVFASLVAGLVGTAMGYREADHERQDADEQRDVALAAKAKAQEESRRKEIALQGEIKERRLKEGALRDAQRERDNYRREVVTHMASLLEHTKAITSEPLLKEYRFAKLKAELLQDALKNFEGFVKRHRDDPKLADDVVTALFGIALIARNTKGLSGKAMQAYRDLVARLDSGYLPTMSDRLLLIKGESENILGVGLMHRKQYAAAMAKYERAEKIFADLVKRSPQNSSYQIALAQTNLNRGILHGERQEWKASLAEYNAAIRHYRRLRLAKDSADVADALLSQALNSVSTVYSSLERFDEAERSCREAVRLREGLVQRRPGVLDYRRGLGSANNNLAELLRNRGKLKSAIVTWKVSRRHFKDVLTADRTSVKAQHDVAFVCLNLGIACQSAGEHRESDQFLNEGLPIWRQLVSENPNNSDYALSLAYMMTISASGALNAQDWDAARRNYAGAFLRLEAYGTRFPKTVRYRVIHAQTLVNASLRPQVFPLKINLKNVGAAVELLDPKFIGSRPGRDALFMRRRALYQHAFLSEGAGDFSRAARLYSETASLMPNRDKSEPLCRLLLCLAMDGQHVKADAGARRFLQTPRLRVAFILAQTFSACVRAAVRDRKLSNLNQSRLANQYARLAVAMLKRCHDGGLFRRADMTDVLTSYSFHANLGEFGVFREFARRLNIWLPAVARKPASARR